VIVVDRDGTACRALAALAEGYPEISVVCADARSLPFADRAVDLAHAALLFHHLVDRDVVRAGRELRRVARRGALVNDLHRHWFAWGAILVLTRVFARSALIRHDAPLSVRRGFKRRELERLLREAGWTPVIRWRWAFRYLVWTENTG
jgi:ubiquinone/menaquinone biosynthesis C-methylase UbiE